MTENHSKQAESFLMECFRGVAYWCGAVLGPIGTVLLVCILVVVGFYQEENWRGKRDWDRVKSAAIAKGKEMDWGTLTPPAVPDKSNFFAAPHMQDWFTGRGSRDLTKRMDFQKFISSLEQSNCVFAKVTIIPPEANIAPSDADIILSFHDPGLSLSYGPEDALTNVAKPEMIPLVFMDDVPLSDAIKNLAAKAHIECTYDPKCRRILPGSKGQTVFDHTVSMRWTDINASEALRALLANYNLRIAPTYAGRPMRITLSDDLKVQMSTELGTTLQQMVYEQIQKVAGTNDAEHLTAAMNFELSARSISSIRPVRVAVRASSVPEMSQVANFFPGNVLGGVGNETHARQTGSNSFELFVNVPARVAAADYLKWTDQFQSDFDAIQSAAKRPFARMAGGYTNPIEIPIPNFVTDRALGQAFSQRAQSHILMHQPEQAVNDLMFIRDVCRTMEGKPTQRPMTLIAAMVDTAVMGIYVQTFADGFHLNTWREQDFAAIQQQLADVDLVPMYAGAMDCERMSGCWAAGHMTTDSYKKFWSSKPSPLPGGMKELIHDFRDPVYQFLFFAPRGWRYQNMVNIERFFESGLGGVDARNMRIVPKQADAAATLVDKELSSRPLSPFLIMAAITIPNFTHAAKTVERNQTLVNQTRIVCALERFRLGQGQYPESLDALVPQFIERLPHDVIGGNPYKYERKGDDFTLSALGWDEKSYVDWPHHRSGK